MAWTTGCTGGIEMAWLVGERIILREYRWEDLPYIRQWCNDPEIVDNLSDIFLYPHSMTATEQFLTAKLEEIGEKSGFVIADRASEIYIGQLDLTNIDWKNRVAGLGIVIAKPHLGQGYGSEALRLLQRFVFDSLNLNRLELRVHDFNHRARRCYEKCGFQEEGRLRQYHFRNGQYSDMIEMSILKAEYEARQRQ